MKWLMILFNGFVSLFQFKKYPVEREQEYTILPLYPLDYFIYDDEDDWA